MRCSGRSRGCRCIREGGVGSAFAGCEDAVAGVEVDYHKAARVMVVYRPDSSAKVRKFCRSMVVMDKYSPHQNNYAYIRGGTNNDGDII